MKRFGPLLNRWWLGGGALAAAGLVVTRVIAPALEGAARSKMALGGELLALGGLAVIAMGISRRANRPSAP